MFRDQVQEMFQLRGKELTAPWVFHRERHQTVQYTQITEHLAVAGFYPNDCYDNFSWYSVLLLRTGEGRRIALHKLNSTIDGGRVNKQRLVPMPR